MLKTSTVIIPIIDNIFITPLIKNTKLLSKKCLASNTELTKINENPPNKPNIKLNLKLFFILNTPFYIKYNFKKYHNKVSAIVLHNILILNLDHIT